MSSQAAELELKQVGSWADYARGPAVGVVVAGNYAYVAAEFAGLMVFDIADPDHPRRVGGYLSYALDVAVAGNQAYLAGSCLEIIDITDPTNPQRAGGRSGGTRKVVVSGSYAYTVEAFSEENGAERGRVGIINVSDPRAPRWDGAYDTSGEIAAIAVSGHHAYLAELPVWNSAAQSFDGLQIIDIGTKGMPRRLTVLSGPAPDGFRLQVRGADREGLWIERSNNLRDWEPRESVTLGPGGSAVILDRDTADTAWRFYRARVP